MSNKAQIGGILEIIAGVLGVLGGLLLFSFIPLLNFLLTETSYAYDLTTDMYELMATFYGFLGAIGVILGALSIVGGVFSIKNKLWGLALAGAIAGIFTVFPLGIAAIILVSMSKPEFDKPINAVYTIQQQAPVKNLTSPPDPPVA